MDAGSKLPVLWIVVPCFNEEDVLPLTGPLFLTQLKNMCAEGLIADTSRILFADDGSEDGTWDVIRGFSNIDSHYSGISLSRNQGHQNALLAALTEACEGGADLTISIDCDGQDDAHAMSDMVREYQKGSEIVYAVRSSRRTDIWFKRTSAQAYYHFLKRMGVDIVCNHADYRLVSRRALREFLNFREVNLFLRGMFPLLGFRSSCVYYERKERMAGKTHYSFREMSALAIDGITSFSVTPLRVISRIGFLVALISFIAIIWTIAAHLAGHAVSGWESMTCIMCFVAGVQMLSLGVIGEYIGKIYLEVKGRPRFIISGRTYGGGQKTGVFPDGGAGSQTDTSFGREEQRK